MVVLPTLFLAVAAIPGAAQEREVVYNEVNVSSAGAGITIEFEDGERLAIEFRDGRIRVDGDEIGRYSPGDALERAWRSLLAEAIAADNGVVGSLLAEWSPPTRLSGEARSAADALEGRLGSALAAPSAPEEAPPADMTALALALDQAIQHSLVEALLRRPELALTLSGVIDGDAVANAEVHVGVEVRIEADDLVDAHLIVVDGNLRVDGEVTGDVTVVGGNVRLGDEARIGGDLRWTGGTMRGNRGGVAGAIRELRPSAASDAPWVADLRAQVEREVRAGLRQTEPSRAQQRSRPGFFRNLSNGIAEVLQTAVTVGILLAIGMGILYFFPRHFEIVARTAAHVPGRAWLVGWAGFLLSPFAWIAGIVLLAISIIGIPLLLIWMPLFGVALAAAMIVGFLSVARNLGAWWANRRDAFQPEGLDPSRPAVHIGIGLVLLFGIFAVAGILTIGGSPFRPFQVLMSVIGFIVLANAAALGFGSALLSRVGRDPTWAGNLVDLSSGEDPFGPEPFEDDSAPDHRETADASN